MLEKISSSVWSVMLYPLLAAGIFLTIRLRFVQFSPRRIFSALRKGDGGGEMSQLATVCTTLAATMGTGNIVGVAAALTIGGAGAIFWMWVSAFLGMAIVYAENFLSVKYRKGSLGGAMLCLENGLHSRPLALVYAALCVAASLGIGNMTQSNSAAAAVSSVTGISPAAVGAICAAAAAVVIIGGAKRIASAAEKLIPILSSLYILSAILVIVYNRNSLGTVFSDIFSGAFGLSSVVGGTVGYTLQQALSTGLRRGVFSNEAGLGSSGIVHAAAGSSPECQGAWGIVEVFLDTIVCCTLTALAVLSSGVLCKACDLDGVLLVNAAFEGALGKFAPVFVSAAVTLFAFATILGWELIGEKAWSYLFNGRATLYYKYIYILFILIGASLVLEDVWYLADIFNALMIAPNLISLILLSGELKS